MPTPTIDLRDVIQQWMSRKINRVKQSNRTLTAALGGFEILLFYYFAQRGFDAIAVVTILAGLVVIGWLIYTGWNQTKRTVAELGDANVDVCLQHLGRYGEIDEIVAQLELELSAPILTGREKGRSPSFFLTEHWLVNFTLLPHQFAYMYGDIWRVSGSYKGTPRGTPLAFFFVIHFSSTQMYVPPLAFEDQVTLLRYLRLKRPGLQFEWPQIYREYFESVLEAAMRAEEQAAMG
ncbi:MAG: hypothetical protein JSS75_09250 [Bacteroidetes bacterium]|nr:hypothetical protein [Bacteroidota bacterium]